MLILVLKEIAHRKTNFLLSLLSIIVAVALFVSCFTMGAASKRETSRLMREMGFNLRIIPKNTDMTTFWSVGFHYQIVGPVWFWKLGHANCDCVFGFDLYVLYDSW